MSCFGCTHHWALVPARRSTHFQIALSYLNYYVCQGDAAVQLKDDPVPWFTEAPVHIQGAAAVRLASDMALDVLPPNATTLVCANMDYLTADDLDAIATHLLLDPDEAALVALIKRLVYEGRMAYPRR